MKKETITIVIIVIIIVVVIVYICTYVFDGVSFPP